MRPRPRLIAAVFASTLFTTHCGQAPRPSPVDISRLAEAWDANNRPERLRGPYLVNLAALPLTGEVARMPWSDSYWPNSKAGLAHRWFANAEDDGFTYEILTRAKVAAMSKSELMRLSPAEKFDIFTKRYDFPFTQAERRRTRPDQPLWWGICHGWASASMNYQEPKPVELANGDGLVVPFGSSDVKALLSFHQAFAPRRQRRAIVGARCNENIALDPQAANRPECRDVNAGSFHLLLTNIVGLEKRSLIADIGRDQEVWNHPIASFSARIVPSSEAPYPHAAPGTVKIVRVATLVKYVVDIGAWWEPTPASRRPEQISARAYEYKLELNDKGEIIGGEWLTTARPDFLWTQASTPFEQAFAPLEKIYQASSAAR